ncbi:MAG: VOC family protein [Chitinophagaceae bacterium]|nr:VOC family protein [Chitinophagaceae bacterium]
MDSKKLTPCLWFDTQAEEAAKFYVSIFKDSKIGDISRYPKEGSDVHHMGEGTVMTVDFVLNGQPFLALNGGPAFKFNEAISLSIPCETQEEVDYYWNKLTEGGEESMCGWLKDKYGLWWQVVPTILPELLKDPQKRGRVMSAFMQMKKFDIGKLKNA